MPSWLRGYLCIIKGECNADVYQAPNRTSLKIYTIHLAFNLRLNLFIQPQTNHPPLVLPILLFRMHPQRMAAGSWKVVVVEVH